MTYTRDLRGYGPNPPDAAWPGGARIAVQFVLNYEEGGENCVLHGDPASEAFLSDIPGAVAWPGQRHWNMESIYEYGARAGFWRVHRLFTGAGIPLTIYGVASALARSPEQVEAMLKAGWEIASHGLKWVEHKDMSEAEERAAIAEAIRLHTEVVGTRPRGWYTGRCSMNTVRLVAEAGEVAYISDSYDDDLPHWVRVGEREQLIIPYTLEANDMRFAATPGYVTGAQFFQYLKDSFDVLYAEGQAGAAKMLSVGLHCRLVGRPGKLAGLQRFIAYIQGFEGVWCPRRIDIAEHWQRVHPPGRGLQVSGLSDAEFVARFAQVFDGVEWVAARAAHLDRGPGHDCLAGLHSLLCRAYRCASGDEQRQVAARFAALGHDLGATGQPDDIQRAVEAIARHRLADILNGLTPSERSQS